MGWPTLGTSLANPWAGSGSLSAAEGALSITVSESLTCRWSLSLRDLSLEHEGKASPFFWDPRSVRMVLFETEAHWPQQGSALTSLFVGSCSQRHLDLQHLFSVHILVSVVEEFLLNPPKAGQVRGKAKAVAVTLLRVCPGALGSFNDLFIMTCIREGRVAPVLSP